MNEGNPTESMDVETFLTESAPIPIEGTNPSQSDSTLPETIPEAESETSGTIYEDFSGTEDQVTEELMIIQTIEIVGSDIAHANLFSGFLVCGTLIGLALLRKIYGT